MTQEQIETLVEQIFKLAEVAVDEHENRESDYSGMDKRRAKAEAVKALAEAFPPV